MDFFESFALKSSESLNLDSGLVEVKPKAELEIT